MRFGLRVALLAVVCTAGTALAAEAANAWLLFYGADGKERRNFRDVGFMKAAQFAAVVRQVVAPATQHAP